MTHKANSFSDCSNCIHCKLESNELFENGLPLNLAKMSFLQHGNSNSSTTSKYYQALNSYLNQANEINSSSNSANTKKYKKLIKIQDCTTWLAMSNSSKNNYNGLTTSLSNSSPVVRNSFSAQNNKYNVTNNQNFTGYKIIDPHYNYTNRINLLLNRKISRSNT